MGHSNLTTAAHGLRDYSVSYSFGTLSGGSKYPGSSPVISDVQGNFYGTTAGGGSANQGAVYELSVSSGLEERVLYSFTLGKDGGAPLAGLIAAPNGDLIGTTSWGGANRRGRCPPYGCGTVFELIRSGETYKEVTLHRFNFYDGYAPLAGLVMDKFGSLYGTTSEGGTQTAACYRGCGVVFKLTPKGARRYTESTIYLFKGGNAGADPRAPLTIGANGTLYGTTFAGGSGSECPGSDEQGCGTAYALIPSAGVYSYKNVYTFGNSPDGALPLAGLLIDSSGFLYGTTAFGGNVSPSYCGGGCGTAFRLDPVGQQYVESFRYDFTPNFGDGRNPTAPMSLGSNGILYGTTESGGQNASGTVFELRPSKSGYTEEVLHSFGAAGDGSSPAASLLLRDKTFFGTTDHGGIAACNCGTVFQFKL